MHQSLLWNEYILSFILVLSGNITLILPSILNINYIPVRLLHTKVLLSATSKSNLKVIKTFKKKHHFHMNVCGKLYKFM